MSTVISAREKEVQNLLRQKEAELKQANAELEERGKLLYKTKVAIEQLQSELTASRKEEAVIREEAQRICDEQAAELRRAEEQLTAVETALQQRTGQAQQLQARVAELEAEAEASKQEQRQYGSAYAAKDRDNIRRIESLQDEVEHQQEQVEALEKLVRERTAQANENKDRLTALSLEKEEAEKRARDLTATNQKLQEDKERLEQQIKVKYQQQTEDLQQQLTDATAQADARLKEKTAADKEWAKRLAAKEKEGQGRLKDAEAKIQQLEDRSVSLSKALSDAQGELSQANLTRQRQLEDAQGSWARQMAEVEAAWDKRVIGVQRAADEAMMDAQKAWERRLRDCEEGWRDKMQQVETNWAMKLSREQQQWEHAQHDWEHWKGRVQDEIEAAQAEAAREARRAASAELAGLESRSKADKLNIERSWALRVEELEHVWSERLQSSLAAANSRIEELKQHGSVESAKAAEAQALKASEAQAKWHKQLDDLKRKWAAEQVSSDRAWAAKLEEAHNRWLKERSQLEQAAAARLEAVESSAAAHAEALRSRLEGRIATVATRLTQLAAQEESREKKRQELAAQVEELRTAGADEFQRRLSLESTLRQAASLFKKELASKSDEVAGLQVQLRGMRHELASSNAYSAAAVTAAGAGRAAAAAGGYGSCGSSPQHTTVAAGLATAPAAGNGAAAGGFIPSPAAAADGFMGSYQPAAAAAGGAHGEDAATAAAAAAAVAAELQALRASRAGYQSAVLQQQAVRNSLLSSLGDRIEECTAARSRSPSRSPVRQRYAAASADHHLIKARHNHWQDTPSAAGGLAAAGGLSAAGNRNYNARKCLFSSPQPAAFASGSGSRPFYRSLDVGQRPASATGVVMSHGEGFDSRGFSSGPWGANSGSGNTAGVLKSRCSPAGLKHGGYGLKEHATGVNYSSDGAIDVDDNASDVTSQASQYEAWQQELSFRLSSALRKLETPVL